MISLIDDLYYERAWCGIEVLLVESLVRSYGIHQWLEAVELDGHDSIREAVAALPLRIEDLELTNEQEDRPKIDFLTRQSRLLGSNSI